MAEALCLQNLREIKILMGPASASATATATVPSDEGQEGVDPNVSESRPTSISAPGQGKIPQFSVPAQVHVPRMFFVFEPFYFSF